MWSAALKPKGPSLDEGDDNSGTQTPLSAQAALPSPNPNDAATTFPRPLPSLPLTPSIGTSSGMEGMNPFYVSTPKPDITIGLAHTAFQPRQQRYLVVHQTLQSILSDSHAADMRLRFPFLVVEAKGLSLTGSLVSAQNQAAVSGAAMLGILQDLCKQADSYGSQVSDSGAEATDSCARLQETPALCISIVIVGRIHDLNVHSMHDEKHFTYPFQTYRTTFHADARKFVACLVQILDWGKGRYKNGIVEQLDQVLKRG